MCRILQLNNTSNINLKNFIKGKSCKLNETIEHLLEKIKKNIRTTYFLYWTRHQKFGRKKVRSEKNIATVEVSIEDDSKISIHRRYLFFFFLFRPILRKHFGLLALKVQLAENLISSETLSVRWLDCKHASSSSEFLENNTWHNTQRTLQMTLQRYLLIPSVAITIRKTCGFNRMAQLVIQTSSYWKSHSMVAFFVRLCDVVFLCRWVFECLHRMYDSLWLIFVKRTDCRVNFQI